MANNSGAAVSLKLLINTQTKKVLFAEAGNDFVDFLFSILSLPVAKVIGLVGKPGMVGSLSNLFESVENLNETYMQPNQDKNALLTPPAAGVPLLAITGTPSAPKTVYKCPTCAIYASDDSRAICPSCNRQMTYEMTFVATPAADQLHVSGEGGFVKGVVTYMVMDDLVVKPMSTISSITMLNKLHVSNVGTLEEKVVGFGMDEAVKLLKTSLETKNVLTRVFLK